jgi:hypothetical protein
MTILMIGTACSFEIEKENVREDYALTVFLEQPPSDEFEQDLVEITKFIDVMRTDLSKPSYIKKFPTFILREPNGEFRTNDYQELKKHLEQSKN